MMIPAVVRWLSFPFYGGVRRPGAWRRLSLYIALALSTATVAAAPSQSGVPPGVRVQLAVNFSDLTVGEVATLSLIVSHPENLTAVLPRLEREWGPFEVQAQTSVQTASHNGGTKTVAKQFLVTLFAPGTFETPDLPVLVRGPDGDVARISPVPVRLTVNPVLLSPVEELKDLRPPANLSTSFWRRPVHAALAAVAVAAILGGGGYLIFRHVRAAGTLREIAPETQTPWEVAAHELERVTQLDLPGRGELRQHYTLVSGILRVYLGATYFSDVDSLDVTDMCTEEINGSIRMSSLNPEKARLSIELLREADLVKFANHVPTADRARATVGEVRNIVEATRQALVKEAPESKPTRQDAAP